MSGYFLDEMCSIYLNRIKRRAALSCHTRGCCGMRWLHDPLLVRCEGLVQRERAFGPPPQPPPPPPRREGEKALDVRLASDHVPIHSPINLSSRKRCCLSFVFIASFYRSMIVFYSLNERAGRPITRKGYPLIVIRSVVSYRHVKEIFLHF